MMVLVVMAMVTMIYRDLKGRWFKGGGRDPCGTVREP